MTSCHRALLAAVEEGTEFSSVYETVLGINIREKWPLFFGMPASTRFHGAESGGLAKHSTHVAMWILEIGLRMIGSSFIEDEQNAVTAALLHDLCKADMYIVSTRNVKKNGTWVQEPFYMVDPSYYSIGHGEESVRRIKAMGIELPIAWETAVRYHMGAFGLSEIDNIQYLKACERYPEVLALHTADMLSITRSKV